jgi:thioester reductase-like protein
MKKYLLLTGATGFIGQYLVRRLLLKGVPLVVVARETPQESASERINKMVSQFEEEEQKTLARPICFTGNIADDLIGLDEYALDWFEQNCKGVIHNAASIRFHAPNGDRTKDPYLSNIGGTKNVLELCRSADIREFHHVSTAYVSGTRIHDTFYEDQLDCGQGYVNDYQVSKAEAERIIRGADFLSSKTFYRPALVIGDSRDGFTTAPDFGLYHYIQFNVEIFKKLRANGEKGTVQLPFRLRFTGEERRNIVTVDWVADAMVHILTNPELHNTTYHLTPEKPSSSRHLLGALARYFDYEGVQFVGSQVIPVEEQTEIERFFYSFVETFEAYWENEPQFDRTNTDRVTKGILPTPPIDDECLHKIIDFAVKHCFADKGSREHVAAR